MTSLHIGWLYARRRWMIGTQTCLLAIAITSQASAQTDTATMSVTANVQSACSVTGGSIDFGNYASGQTNNADAVGTINFTNCTGNVDFELDGGQSGNVNNRAMVNGGNSLSYQLYQTPARNTVFGTGANSLQLNIFDSSLTSIDVFGRIPADQTVPAGAYTDTVNITITF